MEEKPISNNSDRDKSMMNSFDIFKDNKESKDSKKTKSLRLPNIFEAPKETQQEKKAEKEADAEDSKKTEHKDEALGTNTETKEQDANNLEEMSSDELSYAAHEIIESEKELLKEDLAEAKPDSASEAQALAKTILVDNIAEKITQTDKNEVIDDALLDAALAETVEELDINAEAESPAVELVSEEIEADEDEEDHITPAASTRTTVSAPPPPPPLRPTSPTSSSPPLPPPPIFTHGSMPPIGPSREAGVDNITERKRQRAGDVLVGGIIGYLIGRRRGRINTEERLLPVQTKLEQQVKKLRSDIIEREDKISALVVNKIKASPEGERQATTGNMIEKIENKIIQKSEKIPEVRTGYAATGAELTPKDRSELVLPRPEVNKENIDRDVNLLPQSELLEIASHVKVEGVSLKQMFETGRLDNIGLRRVIGEYLRGEKYEKTLYENLRDWQSPEFLRQSASASSRQSGMSAGQQVAGGFQNFPDANIPSGDTGKLPASSSLTDFTEPRQKNNQQTSIIVGVVTAIILLLAWILIRG